MDKIFAVYARKRIVIAPSKRRLWSLVRGGCFRQFQKEHNETYMNKFMAEVLSTHVYIEQQVSITTGNQTAFLPTENRRPCNASQCFLCTLTTTSFPIQIQVYLFCCLLGWEGDLTDLSERPPGFRFGLIGWFPVLLMCVSSIQHLPFSLTVTVVVRVPRTKAKKTLWASRQEEPSSLSCCRLSPFPTRISVRFFQKEFDWRDHSDKR